MCFPGETVLGGGGNYVPSPGDERLNYSSPVDAAENFITAANVEPRGWRVRAANGAGTNSLYAYALCAS